MADAFSLRETKDVDIETRRIMGRNGAAVRDVDTPDCTRRPAFPALSPP